MKEKKDNCHAAACEQSALNGGSMLHYWVYFNAYTPPPPLLSLALSPLLPLSLFLMHTVALSLFSPSPPDTPTSATAD